MRSVLIICLVGLCAVGIMVGAQQLPPQLSDEVFWELLTDFSEPGAFFLNGNVVSNEDDYQAVLPALSKRVKSGGIYVGVGPEQNFTYIAATQPAIAFIVDIRRQNMLAHLLYKALFELSSNRLDFIARLFSRKTPAGLGDDSTAQSIFDAYETAPWDQTLYDANLAAVYAQLTKTHGFQLSDDDKKVLAEHFTYFAAGPTRFWTTPNASYARLMESTDHEGRNWSYLATERNFRRIQDYQKRNLIVPVVGDFAGPKTIRAIGQYARDRSSVVSVFYTSNVDEYLFQDHRQDVFYSNLATFPLDSSSTMIRVVGGPGFGGRDGTFRVAAGRMWAGMLSPMAALIAAFKAGQIRTRTDVNRLSHQ